MNKYFIVLLAVCLVSVHGFVKRDAPAAETPNLDGLKKQAEDLFASVQKQLQETFSADKVNEQLEQLKTGFNELVEKVKPKDQPKE